MSAIGTSRPLAEMAGWGRSQGLSGPANDIDEPGDDYPRDLISVGNRSRRKTRHAIDLGSAETG